MQEITPHIYMEHDYPPYTLGVIITARGVIAIDAPPHPQHARAWLAALTAAWGTPRYLVLTDAQPARLIAAAQWPVPLIVAATTAQQLTGYDEKTWAEMVERFARQAFPEVATQFQGLQPRRPTFIVEAKLHLHDETMPVTLEALHGNAPGSLMVFCPAPGVLFAGDTIAVEHPPAIAQTQNWHAWQKTLAALEKRAAIKQIVPGRGSRPVLRGALEMQKELMLTLDHVASRLAHKMEGHAGLAQATTDLQQAFFPHAARGSSIYQHLREGLEFLVEQKRAQRLETAAPRAAEKAPPPPLTESAS